MKSIYKTASRMVNSVLMITGMLLISSCGMSSEQDTTTVSIEKDGTVRSHIEESFDQSYYDKDELQQKILQEAADYNREVGSGNITVEKVDVKDWKAIVEMTYQKADDFAGFNNVVFFEGTPQEAADAGFELNVVLSGVKDSKDTIGKADILAMEDYRLLIVDMSEKSIMNEKVSFDATVILNGKAEYVNENVTVSDNRKSIKRTENAGGLAYILYK